MGADALNLTDAWSVLGLDGPTEPRAATAAFRTALKAARPELNDGDETRFRHVIEAWRLIRTQAGGEPTPAAATMAPSPPIVVLTPLQAVRGGTVTVQLGGRTLKVRAPKGLRSGDALRLKRGGADGADLTASVLIRSADGLSVLGDDLYMDWSVAPRTLVDGGRLEIETYAGARSAWVTAGQETLRLRLKDLGLPPRGKRPQGHLFVSLKPCDGARSAAEDLLVRFTRVWTPDRLAA